MNATIKSGLIVATLAVSTLLAPTAASAEDWSYRSGYDTSYNNFSRNKKFDRSQYRDSLNQLENQSRSGSLFSNHSQHDFSTGEARSYSSDKFGTGFSIGHDYSKSSNNIVFFSFK